MFTLLLFKILRQEAKGISKFESGCLIFILVSFFHKFTQKLFFINSNKTRETLCKRNIYIEDCFDISFKLKENI